MIKKYGKEIKSIVSWVLFAVFFFASTAYGVISEVCTNLFVAFADTKPNVLFLMADDLGWTDVAYMGSTYHNTPNIDKLAREGKVFMNAYAASPYCVPSRAGIMTGQFPAGCFWGDAVLTESSPWSKSIQGRPKYDHMHTYPLHEENNPSSIESATPIPNYSMAQMFSDNGYNTGHFGKWHLGEGAHAPEAIGFDVNLGGSYWGEPYSYIYPFDTSKNTVGGETVKCAPDLNVSVKKYKNGVSPSGDHTGGTLSTTEYLGLYPENGDFLTDILTDGAISFIDMSVSENKPFFANLWYHNSHLPFTPKPEILAKYINKEDPRGHHKNPAYAALIETLDTNIGRVVDHLKEIGQYDNTIIIFTSDNGGKVDESEFVTSNAPLRGGKGTLYEGGMRVPLAIKWVGDYDKSTSYESVSGIDYYATFKNMLNAEIPENYKYDGTDLTKLITENQPLPSRGILMYDGQLQVTQYATAEPGAALIKDGFKLLYDFNDGVKLYDLNNDISEQVDVAGEYVELTASMYNEIMDMLNENDAYIPKPNPAYEQDSIIPGLLEYYNPETVKLVQKWDFTDGKGEWDTAGHRMSKVTHDSKNGYLQVNEIRQSDPSKTVFFAFSSPIEERLPFGYNILVWRYRNYQPGQTSLSVGEGGMFPARSNLIFPSSRGEWREDVLLFYNQETAADAIMLNVSNRNYYGYNDAYFNGLKDKNDKGMMQIDYIAIYRIPDFSEFSRYAIRLNVDKNLK